MPDLDLLLTLGGLVAGTVVGLTGLGGAAIVTPMLVLLFGIPTAVAVSTDVVSAAVTKPLGAVVHLRRRTPYLQIVLWLSLGSVPGVIVGSLLFASLVEGSDTLLRRLVGVALLVAMAMTLVRGKLWSRTGAATPGADEIPVDGARRFLTLAIGAVVGLFVGLTSVGSGTLIAASLMLLYPAMRAKRLVGTDLVQAVPMLIAGAIAHWGLGEVDVSVLVSLLLGQIPGVWIGARISSRYDGQELRWMLLVLVTGGAIALLGAPAWLATTVTVAGGIGLGAVIVTRTVLSRRAARRASSQPRVAPVPGAPPDPPPAP